MMTIKQFAALCRCNTQTLRYYDRIGLLTPASVDRWTGYRYYEASQAIDFIKIKNLQSADFSIDEIRRLLTQTDQEVYEAFSQKIEQQREKLDRIIRIRQSYLHEKSTMEKIIHELLNRLLEQVDHCDGQKEFALPENDSRRIAESIRSCLAAMLSVSPESEANITLSVGNEVIDDASVILQHLETPGILTPEECFCRPLRLNRSAVEEDKPHREEIYEPIWEAHGWQHVHEFIGSMPSLAADCSYRMTFQLAGEKFGSGITIAMYMLGTLNARHPDAVFTGCSAEKSSDCLNHFILLRKIPANK